MSELEEAIKLFGREDLLGGYGIQDTDTNIEVFMSIKDMVKYYRQDLEIERLNNIINELESFINMALEIYDNVDLPTLRMIKDKIKELKENDNVWFIY